MVCARCPSNVMRKWIHPTRKGNGREMFWRERRALESFKERAAFNQGYQKWIGEGSVGTQNKGNSIKKGRGFRVHYRSVYPHFLNLGTRRVCELCSLQFLPLSSKQKLQTVLFGPFLALDMLCSIWVHGQNLNMGRIYKNPYFKLLLKKYLLGNSRPECLHGNILLETCSDSLPSHPNHLLEASLSALLQSSLDQLHSMLLDRLQLVFYLRYRV